MPRTEKQRTALSPTLPCPSYDHRRIDIALGQTLQQVLQQKRDTLVLGPARLEVLPSKQGMLEWVGRVSRVN